MKPDIQVDHQKRRTIFHRIVEARYTIPIGSVIFVSILTFAFYLVYENADKMRDRINEDFNKRQLSLAREASANVAQVLHDWSTELESLRRIYNSDRQQSEYATSLSEAARRLKTKGIISIGHIDKVGLVTNIFALPEYQALDNLPDPDPSQCRAEPRLFIESSDSTTVGLICMKLGSSPDDSSAIFANIDITALLQALTQRINTGPSGQVWVVDNSAKFVYYPEHELIGQSAFGFHEENRPIIVLSEASVKLKTRLLSGREGTGRYESARHDYPAGRVTRLIAFSPVMAAELGQNRFWTVGVTSPVEAVNVIVDEVYSRHVIIEVALIIGLFVFGWLAVLYQSRVSRTLKERVSEQQEFIASILQNSIDAIVFIDNDNSIKIWNRGAELIFGYSAREMLGRSFHHLVPDDIDADEEIRKIRREVEEKGFVKNYRTTRMTKDNRRITVDISRTLVTAPDGEMLGSTAIIKDITEEVELEQKIYNAEKLASIGTLAAGVAHEINNPLSIIQGFVELLEEKFPEGSSELEDLKIIEQNTQNARKIVDNMLGFARVTEGFADTVDVAEAIETVLKMVTNTLRGKKIEVKINIPEDLPRVKGDAREFQQVIFNLINNAIYAMRDTQGALNISAKHEEQNVYISITDSGEGIPENIRMKIFDPFFTTKKVGDGTGLGLSLCYGIINKYGGTINFESIVRDDMDSKQESGTKFIVTMPIENCGSDIRENI